MIPGLPGIFYFTTMRYINHNGKFLPEGTTVLTADSRAFRYGDGLFETIKYKNGEFILLQHHLMRLWQGLDLLQFEKPRLFTKQLLRDELEALVTKNKDEVARIRMTVFRGNGGLYDPENMHPNYVLQSIPLAGASGVLNSNGLDVALYKEAFKSCDAFSNIKHNNYLPYVMGALFAKKTKCNDALIFNQHMRVCDSTIANIFIIKNGELFTPPLTEGCVAGIMRKFLIEQLPILGFPVNTVELTEEMLLTADEAFLSNSIHNIRWIASIGKQRYTNALTSQICEALTRTNPESFC